ncbi:MAG TPA: glycine zipper domain-containing protein [Candidatus Obscuribacterales bacterium]
MKSIVRTLALLAIVLFMVTSTAPALAFFGERPAVHTGQPHKFGTWRGAALGALGGYATSRLTHSRHGMRNALLGAGIGAYLGHRKRYY